MMVLIVIESITRDNLKMMRRHERNKAAHLGGGIGEYHPIELTLSLRAFAFKKQLSTLVRTVHGL